MSRPLYLAMWSGPRNISTAMMRSFGNRNDTYVCDEPLYAHYLVEHGLDHPGRDEVLAHHETDARKVIDWLTGPIPENKSVFYQKQMAHHLLPDVPRDWLSTVTNAFLVREPREMLTSLLKILPAPGIEDTGLPQQVEIYRRVESETGRRPPVIDVHDVLGDPPRLLALLCDAVGLDFQESMLSWPPGRRETDGAWAPHWYDSVESSTGFQPYQPKDEPVPEDYRELLDECRRHYRELWQHRLR